MNRFSKDIGGIDELLPRVLMDSVQIFLVMCGILANVSIVNPYLLLVMIAVGWFYNKVRIIYMSTAQDVKRLETVGKSN